MTTIASVDTSTAAPLSAFARLSGGAFSPVFGIPMSDKKLGGGGGGGRGSSTSCSTGGTNSFSSSGNSSSGSSSSTSTTISNNVSGRWKRELEPGGGENPPPAKRMSPTMSRSLHPGTQQQSSSGLRHESLKPGELSSFHLGESAVPTAMPPTGAQGLSGRTWQSSPFRNESGGGGSVAHPVPHARDMALSIGRAHTTSPKKVTVEAEGCTKHGRAVAQVAELCPLSPPQLLEKASPMMTGGDQSLPRPCPVPTYAGGGSALGMTPPLGMAGYRRDVLKPSRLKQNAGIPQEAGTCSDSGGGGPGNPHRSMKRPLGGGLRASGSWDGGCASSAPPGRGGGLTALPACRFCGSGGGGNTEESPDGGEGREACSCKGGRSTSTTARCLSPLPFARSFSVDSIGTGHDGRREGDMFSDHMLSEFGLSASPSLDPQLASHNVDGSVGVIEGEGVDHGVEEGGGGGGEARDEEEEELRMLMPSDMHDIEDCMRTLQGTPTHPASHSDHAPSLPPAMGFEVSTSFDGAAYAPERPRDALENGHGHDHHGVGHDSGGEMEVDTGSAPLSDGLFEGALVSGSSGVAASAGLEGVGGTEAGPRVGENHQAVIPTLSSLAGDGKVGLLSPRPPPLQLWKRSVMSQRALDLAFPRPRAGGAGSAELEQKMLSAYLVARADEADRSGDRLSALGRTRGETAGDRSLEGVAGAPAVAAPAATRHTGGGKGGFYFAAAGAGGFRRNATSSLGGLTRGDKKEEKPDSLESLAAFVAGGEGSRWRSDWSEEDREAFRKGVFAFRRDFHRVRARFLPQKEYGDVVDYFYRRWKSNPEYIAWKSTDQLIGRRVAKYVEVVQTPEGGGAAIRFEAMRRGWVTQKDITEDLEEMFVVRFPRMGDDFPVHKQRVELGTLENMLVEGTATDDERRLEVMDSRGSGTAGGGASGGIGSHHLDWRPTMAIRALPQPSGAVRGRSLAWHSGAESVGDDYNDDDARGSEGERDDEGPEDEQRRTALWAAAREASNIQEDKEVGAEDDDEEEEEEEEEGETEETEADEGGGSSDSVSNPDAETDSNTSVGGGTVVGALARGEPYTDASSAQAQVPQEKQQQKEKELAAVGRVEDDVRAPSCTPSLEAASFMAEPQTVFVPSEPLRETFQRASSSPASQQLLLPLQEDVARRSVDDRYSMQRAASTPNDVSDCGSIR